MSIIQLRKVLRVVKAYKDLNEAERSEFDSIARVNASGDTLARIAQLEAENKALMSRGPGPVLAVVNGYKVRAEKAEAEVERLCGEIRRCRTHYHVETFKRLAEGGGRESGDQGPGSVPGRPGRPAAVNPAAPCTCGKAAWPHEPWCAAGKERGDG